MIELQGDHVMALKALQTKALRHSAMALTFEGGYAVMYNGSRVELPAYNEMVVKKNTITLVYDDGSKLVAHRVANETRLSVSAYYKGRVVFA